MWIDNTWKKKNFIWNEQLFVEFFEKNILPLTNDGIMPTYKVINEKWWLYKKWTTKLNRKNNLFSFGNKNTFLNKYNLQEAPKNLIFTYEAFISFFEEYILPLCKDKTMLSSIQLHKKWGLYTSWNSYFIKYIKEWIIKDKQSFLAQYGLSMFYHWEEKEFFVFFERNILPLCKNNIMISSDKLKKMKGMFSKWEGKFRTFCYKDKFKDYNDFISIYWLGHWLESNIKWTEEYFHNFFKDNILPLCIDWKMISTGKIKKLWMEYYSWLNIFYQYRYPSFKNKIQFLKLYKLK